MLPPLTIWERRDLEHRLMQLLEELRTFRGLVERAKHFPLTCARFKALARENEIELSRLRSTLHGLHPWAPDPDPATEAPTTEDGPPYDAATATGMYDLNEG